MNKEKQNQWVYVKDVSPYVRPLGKKERRGVFLCPECGGEHIVTFGNRNNMKSCGCLKRAGSNKTHELSHIKLHPIWSNIKSKCYNKNDANYYKYGARGIGICDEWRNSFETFYAYMSKLDHYGEDGYSIDREDNNGNYEPGNVRWATDHQQATNKGKYKNNKSGYTGVSFNKKTGKWAAYISINGITYNLGLFDTPEDAVTARNNYIIEHGLTEYKIQEIK